MTMTELITATAVLMTTLTTAVQLNNRSMEALGTGERLLRQADQLEAELVLSERQLRDLAKGWPALSAATAASDCALRAEQLRALLLAAPVAAGVQRGAEVVPGAGGLLRIQLEVAGESAGRERLVSLAGLGLCLQALASQPRLALLQGREGSDATG